MKCRHCGSELKLSLVDLGSAPPSNSYLTEQTLRAPEKWFPLRVLVCEGCWLVQTEDFAQAHELFNAEYAYWQTLQKVRRQFDTIQDDLFRGRKADILDVEKQVLAKLCQQEGVLLDRLDAEEFLRRIAVVG